MISLLLKVPREGSLSMNEVSRLISLPLGSVALPSNSVTLLSNSNTDKGRIIALS